MTAFGRMALMRDSAIATWGQRAYEEDIVKGRFFGRSNFIVNTPDAIRHVLNDNYENYRRTPAGYRVLKPVLGEGLLIAEGRAWKHQRRTLSPACTPRAVAQLTPPLVAVPEEPIAKVKKDRAPPRDLIDLMGAARDPETGSAFTDAQLGDEVATMILAGHETTATALFWSLYLLALDPVTQQQVAVEANGANANGALDIEQLKFTRAVIDEIMRLYPPAFLVARAAIAPDTVAGLP